MALGIIAASCGNNSKKAESEAEQAAREDSLRQAEKMAEAEALMQKLEEEPIFDIQTNLGMIKVKLYSKTPKHKANFEKLALSGFYDGILFHRVIDGFMIQGGDPNTKDTTLVEKYGQGGPGSPSLQRLFRITVTRRALLPQPEGAMQPTLRGKVPARSSILYRAKRLAPSSTEPTRSSERLSKVSMSLTGLPKWQRTDATDRFRMYAS